jgi:hypothetical protein
MEPARRTDVGGDLPGPSSIRTSRKKSTFILQPLERKSKIGASSSALSSEFTGCDSHAGKAPSKLWDGDNWYAFRAIRRQSCEIGMMSPE